MNFAGPKRGRSRGASAARRGARQEASSKKRGVRTRSSEEAPHAPAHLDAIFCHAHGACLAENSGYGFVSLISEHLSEPHPKQDAKQEATVRSDGDRRSGGCALACHLTDRQLKPPDVTSHLRWPASGCRFWEMHHPYREERGQPPARLAPSVHFPSWHFGARLS